MASYRLEHLEELEAERRYQEEQRLKKLREAQV